MIDDASILPSSLGFCKELFTLRTFVCSLNTAKALHNINQYLAAAGKPINKHDAAQNESLRLSWLEERLRRIFYSSCSGNIILMGKYNGGSYSAFKEI